MYTARTGRFIEMYAVRAKYIIGYAYILLFFPPILYIIYFSITNGNNFFHLETFTLPCFQMETFCFQTETFPNGNFYTNNK